MANYTYLKNSIRNAIKANGYNEITGNLLQQILVAMVSNLGAAFQFAGVATQSTNPGTPDYNVAYLAGPGTYQNMGGSVVPSGYIGVIAYNGSWGVQLISVGSGGSGSVVTFNNLPNGTTQILVDGVPQATIPSQYTLLKLSAFTTTPDGIANGAFYYNTSDKKIYQKRDLVSVVIPYYDGAIYTYNNALYVWNGTDLVNVGGGGSADFLTEPDDLALVPAAQQGDPSVLKFANRAYNSQSPNGMGYKILRKDATFASQVTDTNTIYEIRYDFDLDGGTVNIPANCVLLFNGGSVHNGRLVLNNTEFSGDIKFGINLNFTNKCVNPFVTPKYFGAKGDGTTNDTNAFVSALTVCDYVLVDGGTYKVNSPLMSYFITGQMSETNGIIITRSNVTLDFINGATLTTELPTNETQQAIRGLITVVGTFSGGVRNPVTNVVIKGAKIIGGRSQLTIPQSSPGDTKENYIGVILCHADDCVVENCAITDNPGDAVFMFATNNCVVRNCKSERNRRSAFSIGSGDYNQILGCFSQDDCQYHDYGSGKTSYGVSPKAILCTEDDSFGSSQNVKMTRTIIRDNRIVVGNADYGFLGPLNNAIIENNIFEDCAMDTSAVVDVATTPTTTNTENVLIRGNKITKRSSFSPLSVQTYGILANGKKINISRNIVDGFGLCYAFVRGGEIVMKDNKCDYGVFSNISTGADEAGGKVIFENNESTANNFIYNALGARTNKIDIVAKGNIIHGTSSIYDLVIFFLSFSDAINMVVADSNIFESHGPTYIFMDKQDSNNTELRFINNVVRMMQASTTYFFNGNPTYTKGDFVGNYLEFSAVATSVLGDFSGKMVFVNNTIRGAAKITTDTETTANIIYSNNIGIV